MEYRDRVEEIHILLANKICKFHHILREGNALANFLASITINKGGSNFTSFNSLEPMGKKLLKSDKL